jgi:hypothetical protein
VLPFDRYPQAGRAPLGPPTGANARHEYGRWLAELTGVTWCAYCGLDLFGAYERWLLLQVDHVVPVAEALRLGVPAGWANDRFNCVLACAGCNGFDNRYTVSETGPHEWRLEAFIALPDRVFAERWQRIADRRARERAAFDRFRLAARLAAHGGSTSNG